MKLCPECLGVGYFEEYQERRKVHCLTCGGDGEIPTCDRCGTDMAWDDDQGKFICPCEEEQ